LQFSLHYYEKLDFAVDSNGHAVRNGRLSENISRILVTLTLIVLHACEVGFITKSLSFESRLKWHATYATAKRMSSNKGNFAKHAYHLHKIRLNL